MGWMTQAGIGKQWARMGEAYGVWYGVTNTGKSCNKMLTGKKSVQQLC